MKNRYLVFITSVLFDLFAAAVSIFISFKLIEVPEVPKGGNIFVFSLLIWPTLMVLSFYIFKTYSVLWRFSRISDLLRVFVGMVVALGALFSPGNAAHIFHYLLSYRGFQTVHEGYYHACKQPRSR